MRINQATYWKMVTGRFCATAKPYNQDVQPSRQEGAEGAGGMLCHPSEHFLLPPLLL